MSGKREYGDYQTPIFFALDICKFLRDIIQVRPSVVLEPTCGIGNFLKASLIFDAQKYYGIEINPEYCDICRKGISDERIKIINADLFRYDLKVFDDESLLVIGNLPWVNNSTLSVLGSDNVPDKINFKDLRGLDALTGESNFDICEYMILKLLSRFRQTKTIIAMLCKTSVARNIFKELKRQKINFEYCNLYEFNASKVFNINASACLILIQLTSEKNLPEYCDVYSFDNPKKVMYSFGFRDGKFYSNLALNDNNFDGKCCFEWRQGVKHDCAKIMELYCENTKFINGEKECVSIERDLVFPLVKSSMFKKAIINDFSKYVIVTQKKVHDETSYIEKLFPQTWEYLIRHRELFERRKSSIYHNAPEFSMFGVGDYSYSLFKVGISGFYKEPLFSVLYSTDKKPVMTDDTSYFICFSSFDNAYVAMLFLNSSRVRDFLKNISFLDAKRPYTKKNLGRIDFTKVYSAVDINELRETELKLGLRPYVTENMIGIFATASGLN